MPRIKGLNRAGRVGAPDNKFTGDEPEWKEEYTVEKYYAEKDRGLRFYAYYCDTKFFKPLIVKWMKDNGYDETAIKLMEGAGLNSIPVTAGKLIRMLSLGMPDLHPRALDYVESPTSATDDIRKLIDDTLPNLNVPQVVSTQTKEKTITAAQRLQQRIEPILDELEKMIDEICEIDPDTAKPKDIPKANMEALLNGIPSKGVGPVIDWLERYHTEFWEAYEKKDEELVDGYGWLKRHQLKRLVDNFEKMLEEARACGRIKPKGNTKRPRKKKLVPPEKQVGKLKYAFDSKEYDLVSVSPENIIGASRVYLFNTKTRLLTILTSQTPAGFKVTGTTIKEFDPGTSYSMRLRKPKESLDVILTKTPLQTEKALATIKTKRTAAKGRVNEHTIILKTIK